MDNSAPTSEMVYQGICQLFHNTNPKEKEKANKWLEEFQKSIYSWTIADKLLQEKRDLHSCYFAAQTMRNKIQNSFNELPATSHNSLRDSLIAHIGQITAETDPIIVTQLSLALADLSLLMASWKAPIPDLLDMLSPYTAPHAVWPLLEILTRIPEEIESRYLRLGANRREEIHKQLKLAAPQVLDFLRLCVQRASEASASAAASSDKSVEAVLAERLLNATLRCFNAWVALNVIPVTQLTENILAQQVFQLLSNAQTSRKLHDTATDCLCAMLACVETLSGAEVPTPANQQLQAQIFTGVCSLENMYHMSVAHEDTDKAMNYCRIFTVLCESFFYELFRSDVFPHYAFKGLDLVLMCVGHFDYDVAEITFNLWYRISEELFQRNDAKLTEHFKPHIERLLGALYRHAQMESDDVGLIEENDSFYDFRRKVSDLIKDVAFIVGSGACFKQMFLMLQAPNNSWEATESALFVMQNVAKCVVPTENEIVPKVVEAILNLPENTRLAVRYTSIMLLGELCDWIEEHPESLEAVLNFLLYSLQQKNGVAAAAAIALTSICAACRQKMTVHISGLVEIARSLDSFEISNDLVIGLLKSIALILSRLPRAQLESTMREIIGFQLQPLAALVDDPAVTPAQIRRDERSDPAFWIDRACAIIRHTNPMREEESAEGVGNGSSNSSSNNNNNYHPTLQIMTEAWPLLSRVMDKYQTQMRIMERTCRLIRYGVRMIRKQAALLLPPLLKQMVCIYTLHHHSCFLYLGSVLMDELAHVADCVPQLLEMLQAFIEPTFNTLQVEGGLKNNPDTVDDFFRLCSRFIEGCPLPFLQSALVSPVLRCALLACTLDHREANKSVMQFFTNLLKWGRVTNQRLLACRPLVEQIAQQHGEDLVVNLIHASVFCLHSYMLPDVAEVLVELKFVVQPAQMEAYLKVALEALPQKNSGGYVTATQEQLNDFSIAVLR